ncbi:MAG: restriction endonuclease subunit S [Phormidesmis sp.]
MDLLEKSFDTAFDAPNGVEKLRELVLTLGMRGKLVPQNPKDRSVDELLKTIKIEKQKLIEEGEIKKTKSLPQISLEEMPYLLPKGWRWTRVQDICHDWGQKTPGRTFTYIDVGSIDSKNGVISEDIQLLESSDAPSRARKLVRKGTVIYSTVRPYLLNIAIVEEEYEPEPIASTAFAILHPYHGVDNRFIFYYLRSAVFIRYVEAQMKGVAYPAINDGNFFRGLFPLPPTAEQCRIVAKIDQLMARCDELENLRESRDRLKIKVHMAACDRLLTAPDTDTFTQSWQFITQHFSELYTVKENVTELRKAILQLAIMGKLVPQNPTEPPARELVKEIEAAKQRLTGHWQK